MRRSEMLSVVYGSVISLTASPGLHPRARCDKVDQTDHHRPMPKVSSVPPAVLSWQQTSQFMATQPFSHAPGACGRALALAPWLFGDLPTHIYLATPYARGSPASRRAGWRGTPSRSHCFSQTRTVRQSRKEPAAPVPTPSSPRASRPSPRTRASAIRSSPKCATARSSGRVWKMMSVLSVQTAIGVVHILWQARNQRVEIDGRPICPLLHNTIANCFLSERPGDLIRPRHRPTMAAGHQRIDRFANEEVVRHPEQVGALSRTPEGRIFTFQVRYILAARLMKAGKLK